ncbi:MAG: type I methionyl aminopeptidase [Clostridia bacterium]|nr:type I methionyl aminopeptidase [Clostridia bacterium]
MSRIVIKMQPQLERMREAGRLTYRTLALLAEHIRPGVTTKQLDAIAHEFIADNGGTPSFLGYMGYPAAICASVNSTVIHGIPDGYALRDGDIVSIDVGAFLDGYHGDAARTYPVGDISPENRRLIETTKRCFLAGAAKAVAGNYVCDISREVQRVATEAGYGIVREFVGHGVGKTMHEAPEVPNFFSPQQPRVRLHEGMTIAIEPMINAGSGQIRVMKDGWAVVTADGMPSAHYENTIAVTKGEPLVLTDA